MVVASSVVDEESCCRSQTRRASIESTHEEPQQSGECLGRQRAITGCYQISVGSFPMLYVTEGSISTPHHCIRGKLTGNACGGAMAEVSVCVHPILRGAHLGNRSGVGEAYSLREWRSG
jgi:hypothetical protein